MAIPMKYSKSRLNVISLLKKRQSRIENKLARWWRSLIIVAGISASRRTVVANVAQLVEQRFRKARVAGSSPVVGSIFPFTISDWRLTRIAFSCER
jgi:hypothetical protein